jgi:hypothetical protein
MPYKTLDWMLKRWSDGPDSSVILIVNIVSLISEFTNFPGCSYDRNFPCQTLKIRNVSLVVMGS